MSQAPSANILDCVIIGGGPAGLTAALYLARFNRNFAVIDGGESRASWIPETHNLPLFTQGIAGPEILRRQREHAEICGARLISGKVTELSKTASGFGVRYQKHGAEPGELEARFALLATGVIDIPPRIPDVEDAVQCGLVRYCPICDGYEAKGKKVAVIGIGNKGLGEAAFIARTYSSDVTLLSFHEPLLLNEEEDEKRRKYRIRHIGEPIRTLARKGGKVCAKGTQTEYDFDVVYSALGVEYRSGLATALGAISDPAGALKVDEHSETSVPDLYAAGDVTQGLNQIVVAMGQAAKAATAMHNRF